MSQKELALRASVSPSLVTKLERGSHDPRNVRVKTLAGILAALEWTPEEFTVATGIQLLSIAAGTVGPLTDEELEAMDKDLERLEEFTGGDLLRHIRGARKSIERLLGETNEAG